MIVKDRIYGKCHINEPVLIDLIGSEAITRLGKINQYGAIYQIYPQFFTTRKEHSIGVMLLLRMLGASLEEQIAGLIHDVPHTAFSHVIDYVFGDQKMESSYHEVIQREVLEKSDIPSILNNYNLDKNIIFEIDDYKLLERDLPDLCGDRVDYILRDLLTYGLISDEEVKDLLKSFIVRENKIVFDNADRAFLMASKSIEANRKIWSSPYQIYIARRLADGLKLSLERGYIDLADLHSTDNRLYRKLVEIEDDEVQNILSALTKKIVVTIDEEESKMKVYTKLRVIDPLVETSNGLKRLSKISNKFREIKEVYTEKHSKGFSLNIRDRKEGEQIVD